MSSSAFVPVVIEINSGDTVKWKNTSSAPHSVTARDGSFDSSPGPDCSQLVVTGCMAEGAEFSQIFNKPAGTVIEYVCKVHEASTGMTGQVKIVAAPSPSPSPTKAGPSPSPSNAAPPSPSPSPVVSLSAAPQESPTGSSGGPTGTVIATGGESDDDGGSPIKVIAIVAIIIALGSAGGLWYLRKTPA